MAFETYKEEKEGQKITAPEEFLRKEWALLVILILPFILIALYWNAIPDQIPLHWNMRGEVNRWGSKSSVFDAPLINIGIAFLLYYLPRIDPLKSNYALFPRAYRMVRLVIAAFLFAIFLMTISSALGLGIDPNMFVYIAVPLLFLVVGNFMRNFRQNFFAGIRTPWTLVNQQVWEQTHKFAAWLWTGGSLVIIIIRLLAGRWEYFPYVFMGYIGVLIVIPIVMSYIYFRRTKV